MKIKVGDTVKFLNDVGGGKVTKILDKDTALVLNDTGFEIPVLINELLPDVQNISFEAPVSEKEVIPEINPFEEEPIITESNEVNFYLAYVPADQTSLTDCDSEIYLINDSNFFVYYNFSEKKSDSGYVSITGKIEPNVKEKIGISTLSDLKDNTELIIQIIYYKKDAYTPVEPVSKYLKIHSSKFFKEQSFKENDFFDAHALILKVTESNDSSKSVFNLTEENDGIKKEKNDQKSHKPAGKKKKKNTYLKEVDLHMHELIDDETGLSDHDKLQYQLDIFHKEMEDAIKQNYKRIVFIHGVGSGSLKLKIRSELQLKYKKYKFQDASFKEYGYGATMVLLRR